MNKKIWIPALLVLILAGALIAYFSGMFMISSISGRGLTHEVKSDVWEGYDVELQAAHWGSLTSKASKKIYSESEPEVSTGTIVYGSQNSDGKYWYNHFDFCGDNDGENTINNGYSVSGNFELTSSKGSSRCCNDANYVTAKVMLPKGTIKAICNAKSSDAYGEGWVECGIGDVIKKVKAWPLGEGELSEAFEVVIEEDKEVLVYLKTFSGCKAATSTGKIMLEFEEYVEPVEEVAEASEETAMVALSASSEETEEENLGDGGRPIPGDNVWSKFVNWVKSLFSDVEWF